MVSFPVDFRLVGCYVVNLVFGLDFGGLVCLGGLGYCELMLGIDEFALIVVWGVYLIVVGVYFGFCCFGDWFTCWV